MLKGVSETFTVCLVKAKQDQNLQNLIFYKICPIYKLMCFECTGLIDKIQFKIILDILFTVTGFATKNRTYINILNNQSSSLTSWDVFLRLQYTFQHSSLHLASQNTMSREFLYINYFGKHSMIKILVWLMIERVFPTLVCLWVNRSIPKNPVSISDPGLVSCNIATSVNLFCFTVLLSANIWKSMKLLPETLPDQMFAITVIRMKNYRGMLPFLFV